MPPTTVEEEKVVFQQKQKSRLVITMVFYVFTLTNYLKHIGESFVLIVGPTEGHLKIEQVLWLCLVMMTGSNAVEIAS